MFNGGKAGLTRRTETRAAQRVTVMVNAGFNIKTLNTHICDHIDN